MEGRIVTCGFHLDTSNAKPDRAEGLSTGQLNCLYHFLNERSEHYQLDYSHFVGQAHNKGKPSPKKKKVEEYLVKNSKAKSHLIRIKLIEEGYKKTECEICFLTEWNGVSIPLELHHINGDHWDNRLENLQIICPNCHTLETARVKNKN